MNPAPPPGVTAIPRGDPSYPARLMEVLGEDAPAELSVLGDPELLRYARVGVFSSIRTPPELILRSFDLARTLRGAGIGVASGFQSPLERECLALLIRGKQPVIASPAAGIGGIRVPRGWRRPLQEERLLVLSPFGRRLRRPTVGAALFRNRVVAALAERIFVIHARPGSRTFRTAAAALERGQPVYCFDHPRNRELLLLGAEPADGAGLARELL